MDAREGSSARAPQLTPRCISRHAGWLWRLAAGVTAGLLLAGCGAGSTGGQAVTTAGYNGPVLVSADGLALTVGGGNLFYPCFGTLTPVATQERSVVALWLRYVTPVHHGPCQSSMARYPNTTIRLTAPVGSRELVNGATGHQLPWFSQRQVLRPSAIPAGLRPQAVTLGISDDQSFPGKVVSGYSQSFQSASYFLDITQSSLQLQLPEAGRVPAAIEVRGRPGMATVGDTLATGIMWPEAGMFIEITAEYRASSGSPLSVQQLIAIADSAPPLAPAPPGWPAP